MTNGPIILTKGNLPLLTGSIVDQTGAVVNLTGCTVAFAWQQLNTPLALPGATFTGVSATTAATIVNAVLGQVSYQLVTGQTANLGDYVGQWQVTNTNSGLVTAYPKIQFRVIQAVPQATPSNIILVRQMFEPVRCILGDFNAQFRKYQDDSIAAVVRTCLMKGVLPQQWVTPDGTGISPGITLPSDMALLMYHSAKMFVMPNVAGYSYGTRAIKERFERQDHFIFDLENAIHDLENGGMFSAFQSFYAWVNALTGIDIWSLMSDMETDAPVATVMIGRAGVTVATT
jgi:hypothetical protein